MNSLADLDIFARVVTAGSMSAAGRELGFSPAVISKRIRRLEERLGTRLLHRTTRQIAMTEAGQGFYERVVAILASAEEAEAWVARRSSVARGILRVSAPTSFGRLHIAPHLRVFLESHPDLTVDLELSDAFVDIVGDGFDLAVRIADLQDSSLVARRLAPNHRILCAAPLYLKAHGQPSTPADLARHRLLAHNADQWRLEGPDGPITVRLESPLRTNSSEVVREAVIAGVGIALRSTWDVGSELRSGALVQVLPGYGGSRKAAIHAVYPSRRHLAQKVRGFIDHLAELYGPTPPWDEGLEFLKAV
jgi:DNA-binding transcriptional LysR family regulator